MRGLLRTGVIVLWGLWFGGLATVFLVARAMFQAGRELGAQANPVMFATFERYQMVLAGLLLIGTGVWFALSRGRVKMAVLVLFILAAVAATLSWTWITPQLNALQAQGLTHSPAFRALHGRSMMSYSAAALLLLVAGLLLPHAERKG